MAVLALAIGLAAGWSIALILAAATGLKLGESGVQLLSGLGGAMVGLIAAYVGAHIRGHGLGRRRDDDDDEV